MSGYIDEYMLKLGAVVDQSGMQRFHQALRETTAISDSSAKSIAGAFLKAEVEIVGGFAAIGTAAVGLVDKVAMADQSYRLFALHMYMSKENARGLKVAMDALGASLEDMTWDKELRERTHQLLVDQRNMAPAGDFDAQMKKVRDIRFEFTRMEVEGEYLAMHVVQDFMKALGFGPDELLGKLQKFNDWVTHNLPQISERIVHDFLPVWKDVKDVLEGAWQVGLDFTQVFTNVMSLLSGDQAIGGAITFEKFAGAVEHVVHALALVAEYLEKITGLLAGSIIGGSVGGVIGAILGGVAGAPAGPAGIVAGALAGGAVGTGVGAGVGGAAGGAFDLYRHFHPAGLSLGDADSSAGDRYDTTALIQKYANKLGISAHLAQSLSNAESRGRQYKSDGSLVTAKGSSATGAFQLLNATAKALGVDSTNPDDNVKGGVTLLQQLLTRYNGNVPAAVAAYHDGPGIVDKVMNKTYTGRATLSSGARAEVASVMRQEGATGDVHIGNIVVNITKPNAVNADVARAVAAEVRSNKNKSIQRNLAETQGLSYGY